METTVDGLKELFRDVIKEEFGPMKPILCKFALELVDELIDAIGVSLAVNLE